MPDEHPPEEVKPKPGGESFALYQLVSDSLHVLDATDVCVTLSIPNLDKWYEQRLGVPVTVSAWPEIERILVLRINELKVILKPKGKRIVMRVLGPCREWIAMKTYKALYPHCEAVQYVGDGVIDI